MFEYIGTVDGIVRANDLVNGGIWTGTPAEYEALGGSMPVAEEAPAD